MRGRIVATPCLDDHYFKEENGSVGQLSVVCSQMVVTCMHLARIGRPDIYVVCEQIWSCGHKMDKSDNRLARLIAYIHHTSEFGQYWYVGNTAQCRVGLFQVSDLAGDLEDSKSTSGGLVFSEVTRLCQ